MDPPAGLCSLNGLLGCDFFRTGDGQIPGCDFLVADYNDVRDPVHAGLADL
jgi:hypothetical protein